MRARDVMTRGVISVDPNATVLQAARIMLQHHISGLPVVDSAGKLVGVLSEGDFLRRQETGTERRRSRWLEFLMGPGRMAADYSHSHGSKVAEVMTADVQTVDEDARWKMSWTLMEERRIKRVPVLRGGPRRHRHPLQSHACDGQPGARGAAGRGRRCRHSRPAAGEHADEAWAPAAMANVMVRGGVVELWGVVVDERQREALKVAAENIPGVKAVKDHLTWVEPMSGVAIEPNVDIKDKSKSTALA